MPCITGEGCGLSRGCGCWYFLVSRSCKGFLFCSIDHLSQTNPQMHPNQHNTQIKFNLIHCILCGEIEHSAASDFSSIPWVKPHPGNREESGQLGLDGLRETVTRLLNYRLLSVESAEWENCPRGEKRSRRSNRFMARLICFTCLHPPASSLRHQWNTHEETRAHSGGMGESILLYR